METTELRIGNYFHPISKGGGIHMPATLIMHKVYAIDPFWVRVARDGCTHDLVFRAEDIHPVELTPEILVKCGFEHDGIGLFNSPEPWYHIVEQNGDWIFRRSGFSMVQVHSLHQLQNLFFAITGRELNYTP